MTRPVLGIDIGKKSFDVALIMDGKFTHKNLPNNLDGFTFCKNWLEGKGIKPAICMEATGIYSIPCATFFHGHNYEVSIVNAVKIKRFAESQLSRIKTDKADAKVIAQYCQLIVPELWKPKDPSQNKLRSFVVYLDSLVKMLGQEKVRLESSTEDISDILKSHISHLETLINDVEREIKNIIDTDQMLKVKRDLLQSIPGLGNVTISRILAFIANVEDFTSPKQLVAFVGLNPKQHQSGSSVNRRTKISKTGDPRIRKALFMPALVAMKHNPIIRDFYNRLLSTGKNKMAAVIAVMRKLLHLIYGVLKSGKKFDPNYLN